MTSNNTLVVVPPSQFHAVSFNGRFSVALFSQQRSKDTALSSLCVTTFTFTTTTSSITAMARSRTRKTPVLSTAKGDIPDRACYGCGETGHLFRDCPKPQAPGPTCWRCGGVGHLARSCPVHIIESAAPPLSLLPGLASNTSSDSQQSKPSVNKSPPPSQAHPTSPMPHPSPPPPQPMYPPGTTVTYHYVGGQPPPGHTTYYSAPPEQVYYQQSYPYPYSHPQQYYPQQMPMTYVQYPSGPPNGLPPGFPPTMGPGGYPPPVMRGPQEQNITCYRCGGINHLAKNCTAPVPLQAGGGDRQNGTARVR